MAHHVEPPEGTGARFRIQEADESLLQKIQAKIRAKAALQSEQQQQQQPLQLPQHEEHELQPREDHRITVAPRPSSLPPRWPQLPPIVECNHESEQWDETVSAGAGPILPTELCHETQQPRDSLMGIDVSLTTSAASFSTHATRPSMAKAKPLTTGDGDACDGDAWMAATPSASSTSHLKQHRAQHQRPPTGTTVDAEEAVGGLTQLGCGLYGRSAAAQQLRRSRSEEPRRMPQPQQQPKQLQQRQQQQQRGAAPRSTPPRPPPRGVPLPPGRGGNTVMKASASARLDTQERSFQGLQLPAVPGVSKKPCPEPKTLRRGSSCSSAPSLVQPSAADIRKQKERLAGKMEVLSSLTSCCANASKMSPSEIQAMLQQLQGVRNEAEAGRGTQRRLRQVDRLCPSRLG